MLAYNFAIILDGCRAFREDRLENHRLLLLVFLKDIKENRKEMTRNGQKWPEMARNGKKWQEMARNGRKMTIVVDG